MSALTTRQILALSAALSALDGVPKPDGTIERYTLSGKSRYAIARSIVHLKPMVEAFEKARSTIVGQHSDGKAGVSANDPRFLACQGELDAVLDAPVEVQLHRFKLDDLDLEKNAIPPTVLANLDPVIEV